MIRWIIFVILLLPNSLYAQGVIDRNHVPSLERVDPLERRRDDIDGNNIRATITNWVQTASSGTPGDFWYEWPKNTNRRYVALTQLWVGAETTVNTGPGAGERLWVFDVADFRGNNTGGNSSWTFEPIGGYVNPAGSDFGIAQSDEPDSWPPFWPDKLTDKNDPGWSGSWNGFFGRDIYNADQEFFFKAGDDQYDRYRGTYSPDTTDPSRHGLGLIIETRIMAWTQILVDDVVFLIYGVKNDGTEDLDKVGMSVWLADCVAGDCGDDVIFFDLLEDVAFMTDEDGIGDQNFGSDPAGTVGIAMLETPGNALDRIDNDGDGSVSDECPTNNGECNSPIVPESFLVGELPANGIDDNGNGLIDESSVHVPFGSQTGVGFADYIDNDDDGEQGAPRVTQEMVTTAASDPWLRWPPSPQNDPMQQVGGNTQVHLINVTQETVGLPFRDNIDNDDSHIVPSGAYPYLSESGSPIITQAMIDEASADPYRRYQLKEVGIILYGLGPEDLGKAYADGLDNDEDGAIDEGIDEGTDEMIDESRADGIDNDQDWILLQNDTGLDGIQFSGDLGDGDGQPTSGAGTNFPGEKNIDVTDVSESDQIGITNVRLFGANTLAINSVSDRYLFFNFLIPGDFDTEQPDPGDNDLTVSSGLFPLKAGQTERISISVQLGIGQEEVLSARDNALDAYQEDYQFAQAPITPEVFAVEGDGRVTLYWDSKSEESDDGFLRSLGLPSKDFEGYRVYRATDPAFLDALQITDGRGNLTFRKPIAQFDLINGIGGFHPVSINGLSFYMGDDRVSPGEGSNGLAHSFIDSTVTNGVTYYYAVTAYDFGAFSANISPTETPVRIRRLPDGTVETGRNVVAVTPTAPVAGYQQATIETLNGYLPRVRGSTSSRIGYTIIDPRVIEEGKRFQVTFTDTLLSGGRFAQDTISTNTFSLKDLQDDKILINQSGAWKSDTEFPTLDDFGNPIGFSLQFFEESLVRLNSSLSGWTNENVYPIVADPYISPGFTSGQRNPADYMIEVVGPGEGRSTALDVSFFRSLPARPTNVRVYRLDPDKSGGSQKVEVDYGFWDLTGDDFISPQSSGPATFSADRNRRESDLILIHELLVGERGDAPQFTWRFGMNFAIEGAENPSEGDVASIITRKPFLASDVFEFETYAPSASVDRADSLLSGIRVVPNPYVATNRFEQLNAFSTGRGDRAIRFINLPPDCTLRIFNVSGRLIRTLYLNEGVNDPTNALLNGTIRWDLQSSDALTVSYGVYLYHVEAPSLGETTGTFAIIK
ncbi:MAG: hypothetical protein OXE59_03440 [Bacteroidetes bacterium]|nr:hypothetical protein [Bacteroidota bacterium]